MTIKQAREYHVTEVDPQIGAKDNHFSICNMYLHILLSSRFYMSVIQNADACQRMAALCSDHLVGLSIFD